MTDLKCCDCPNFKPYPITGVGLCLRWKLTKYMTEKCDCDPCSYCQNFSETYDSDTGYSDYGCKADDNFPYSDRMKPCPYFKPILASDGLFEQISEWKDEEMYREMMKELRERND